MNFEDEIWSFNGTEQDGAYADIPVILSDIDTEVLDKLKLISNYHKKHDYYRVNLDYIEDIKANAVIIYDDTLEFHYYLNEKENEKYYKDIDKFDDLLVENNKSDLKRLLSYLKDKETGDCKRKK